MTPIAMLLLLLHSFLRFSKCSELGAVIGDGAASQMLNHAAHLLLAEPRVVNLLLATKDDPQMGPLANLKLHSGIGFKNVSLFFLDDAIRIRFDQMRIKSQSNLTHLLWPVVLGDHVVDMDMQMTRGDFHVKIDEETFQLRDCAIHEPSLSAHVHEHWLVDQGVSLISSLLSPALDSTLCSFLNYYVQDIPHKNIMKFPIHALLSEKARLYLAQNETNLFYRLKTVEIQDHQLTVRAILEWNSLNTTDNGPFESNTTQFEMELKGDDRVTIWLEDSILNELINQVDWNFEWMKEQVPVSSPLIPPEAREFLAALCTDCYFLLNVWARGNPSIQATNNSLIFEKTDRMNLRVVNPDRNVTAMFVALVLTIQAEVRPTFDNGVLRTLVQLLDTNIALESGAFPKLWGPFMQDLIRGMILDMMWPEIKNAIEELTYGKGLQVPVSCGIDPMNMDFDIGEGAFSLTTRLSLSKLDPETCLQDLKSAIPNTNKFLQKIDGKKRK